MDETKVFKTENDGMLMEFATGIKEYCRNHADCEKCIFLDSSRPLYPPLWCKVDYPINWRV